MVDGLGQFKECGVLFQFLPPPLFFSLQICLRTGLGISEGSHGDERMDLKKKKKKKSSYKIS